MILGMGVGGSSRGGGHPFAFQLPWDLTFAWSSEFDSKTPVGVHESSNTISI